MDPKHIVGAGYDTASYHYRPDPDLLPGDPQPEATLHYHVWLDRLEPLLSPGIPMLELGCGCGLPVARRLAPRYRYTGVDISPVQCQRARQNAPSAAILCADMTMLDFPRDSFAAWLQPGGLFMVTLPLTAWTGTEDNWHGSGATMYWSHADTPTYLRWLEELSFTILWTTFLPEGEDCFNLVLAKKKGSKEGKCGT